MDLKIEISKKIYDAITKEDQISFSELHELFDTIRNGIPADGSPAVKETNPVDEVTTDSEDKFHAKKIDSIKKESKENQDEIHAKEDAESVNEFAEVCHLIIAYLGRELDPHEANIICLYDAIRKNKKTLAELDGAGRIFMKMFIRSLVSQER